MYVDDMDMNDAREFLREAVAERAALRRAGRPVDERLDWDIEDLEGRIADLAFGRSTGQREGR